MKMTKCDFCDKDMIGSTGHQMNMYCTDHEAKALAIESNFYAEMGKWEEERMEKELNETL
jgi:hypothetical protein